MANTAPRAHKCAEQWWEMRAELNSDARTGSAICCEADAVEAQRKAPVFSLPAEKEVSHGCDQPSSPSPPTQQAASARLPVRRSVNAMSKRFIVLHSFQGRGSSMGRVGAHSWNCAIVCGCESVIALSNLSQAEQFVALRS